jgi:translation initiation factor IF-3
VRKSYKFSKRRTPVAPRYRTNSQIFAPVLKVIDENGVMLGETPLAEARKMAEDRGFDLVEVVPNATPPIAKLLDYGKFQYQQEKILRKQKSQQKKIEVKGIRLSLKIGDHDLETKLKQTKGFFEEGHKVKVEVILKGREMQHADLARKVISDFLAGLHQEYIMDQPISKQGNKFFIVIADKV